MWVDHPDRVVPVNKYAIFLSEINLYKLYGGRELSLPVPIAFPPSPDYSQNIGVFIEEDDYS